MSPPFDAKTELANGRVTLVGLHRADAPLALLPSLLPGHPLGEPETCAGEPVQWHL